MVKPWSVKPEGCYSRGLWLCVWRGKGCSWSSNGGGSFYHYFDPESTRIGENWISFSVTFQ